MRIVHCIFAFNTGGAETMLVDIVNEQSQKVTVYLVIVNDLIDEKIISNVSSRVNIIRLNRKPKSFGLTKIIELNYILLKIKPNVIHCHTHTLAKVIFVSKITFAKYYLTVHDTNYTIENYGKFDKLFAISNAVKKDILEKGNFNIEVVYNGIKTNMISKKTNFKLDKTFNIVQVGRLEHSKKGQHVLIEALSYLVNDNLDFWINIDFIGNGSSLEYLNELVSKYNLSEHVHFLGNHDRNFIYNNLKNYDLLVQPSLFEGFGLSVAESMAANVPVLISNIEGPMEIINNGKYGYFFENNNAYDLAVKIKTVINDYKLGTCLDIIQKANIRVCNTFDIKETANRYIENY